MNFFNKGAKIGFLVGVIICLITIIFSSYVLNLDYWWHKNLIGVFLTFFYFCLNGLAFSIGFFINNFGFSKMNPLSALSIVVPMVYFFYLYHVLHKIKSKKGIFLIAGIILYLTINVFLGYFALFFNYA